MKAAQGRVPVFLDGGVRRGTDVFKALALGASGIFVSITEYNDWMSTQQNLYSSQLVQFIAGLFLLARKTDFYL